MNITLSYAGIFSPRASRSDDILFRKIVIASKAWRSYALAQRHEIATPVPSIAMESLKSSQRRLQQPRLVNNPRQNFILNFFNVTPSLALE
jgi:hypothetical protein